MFFVLSQYMVIDTIRTIKLLGKWSANRFIGKKRPLIAVFSLTHYCNFYCPMCPFGDSDKINQFKFAKKNDLSTSEWKSIFDKVSKYCIWSIIEGGEPTSRPDFMELVTYLHTLNMPITLITNCSLLDTIDLKELKKYIQFITCSIDSVFEKSYCKIRGVSRDTYDKVMKNLLLLNENNIPHYFNSVITKYNTEEFINQSYFDRAKELGSNAVSFTFVEDRSDVDYSLLPDRKTMIGVWESIFINGNGTVLVPCWKYNSPENTYNLLEQSIDEIWESPKWDIAKTCHDCQVLGCIWYSSQPVTTFAKNYMRGLSNIIAQQKPDILGKENNICDN